MIWLKFGLKFNFRNKTKKYIWIHLHLNLGLVTIWIHLIMIPNSIFHQWNFLFLTKMKKNFRCTKYDRRVKKNICIHLNLVPNSIFHKRNYFLSVKIRKNIWIDLNLFPNSIFHKWNFLFCTKIKKNFRFTKYVRRARRIYKKDACKKRSVQSKKNIWNHSVSVSKSLLRKTVGII